MRPSTEIVKIGKLWNYSPDIEGFCPLNYIKSNMWGKFNFSILFFNFY
jgi:hypothetical protein